MYLSSKKLCRVPENSRPRLGTQAGAKVLNYLFLQEICILSTLAKETKRVSQLHKQITTSREEGMSTETKSLGNHHTATHFRPVLRLRKINTERPTRPSHIPNVVEVEETKRRHFHHHHYHCPPTSRYKKNSFKKKRKINNATNSSSTHQLGRKNTLASCTSSSAILPLYYLISPPPKLPAKLQPVKEEEEYKGKKNTA